MTEQWNKFMESLWLMKDTLGDNNVKTIVLTHDAYREFELQTVLRTNKYPDELKHFDTSKSLFNTLKVYGITIKSERIQ